MRFHARSWLSAVVVGHVLRGAAALVLMDVTGAVGKSLCHGGAHHELCAWPVRQRGLVIDDGCGGLQPESTRSLHVDEQHADLCVGVDVAHREVHAIAVIAWELDGSFVDHPHEAHRPALIRHGWPTVGVDGREKEKIA